MHKEGQSEQSRPQRHRSSSKKKTKKDSSRKQSSKRRKSSKKLDPPDASVARINTMRQQKPVYQWPGDEPPQIYVHEDDPELRKMNVKFNNISDIKLMEKPKGAQILGQIYYHSGMAPEVKFMLQEMLKSTRLLAQHGATPFEAEICIMGELVQTVNPCCHVLPLIFCICIFPILLFRMDCWRQYTAPKYAIEPTIFKEILDLAAQVGFSRLELVVRDNDFGKSKANQVNEFIRQSNVSYLKLDNLAPKAGWKHDEFDQFKRNTSRLRKNAAVKYLKWGKETFKQPENKRKRETYSEQRLQKLKEQLRRPPPPSSNPESAPG